MLTSLTLFFLLSVPKVYDVICAHHLHLINSPSPSLVACTHTTNPGFMSKASPLEQVTSHHLSHSVNSLCNLQKLV